MHIAFLNELLHVDFLLVSLPGRKKEEKQNFSSLPQSCSFGFSEFRDGDERPFVVFDDTSFLPFSIGSLKEQTTGRKDEGET